MKWQGAGSGIPRGLCLFVPLAFPSHPLGFLGGLDLKESTCNTGGSGVDSWFRRSPRERNGYPLQENFQGTERPAWQGLQFTGSQRVGHDWFH